MRLLVNTLIVVMALAIVAAAGLHYVQQRRLEADIGYVRRALDELHQQARYHKALDDANEPTLTYPRRPRAHWFDQTLPSNAMVARAQPWIDIAPERDAAAHPPDPVIAHSNQAGFWYNPSNGIFRARVPRRPTRAEMLRLYNRLNGTSLTRLPGPKGPTVAGKREPEPLALVRTAAANAGLADNIEAASSSTTSQPVESQGGGDSAADVTSHSDVDSDATDAEPSGEKADTSDEVGQPTTRPSLFNR